MKSLLSKLPSFYLLFRKILNIRSSPTEEELGRPSCMSRPTDGDCIAWQAYWKSQKQHWRIEPEIDIKRQEELTRFRNIVSDIQKGRYPFKEVKLCRADIEWLLATHNGGRSPVDWSDDTQQECKGLDLRGANLFKADLHGLPLSSMLGGMAIGETVDDEPTQSQCTMAAVILIGANLRNAHLEGAQLQYARLEYADFSEAHMKRADLQGAYLRNANLWGAQAEDTSFICANLESVNMCGANLQGSHLDAAYAKGAFMPGTRLEGATIAEADLREVNLEFAHLEAMHLVRADLRGARLAGVRLEGADLSRGDLRNTEFVKAHLEDADLTQCDVRGANFCGAYLTGANLGEICLSDENQVGPRVADVQWSNVDLTTVKWSKVKMLGDERLARKGKLGDEVKGIPLFCLNTTLDKYEAAVRANRQLANSLQAQGLNEDAACFAYRAKVLQRHVLWLQMFEHRTKLGQRIQLLGAWMFSWFLFLFAGYGYKMWRSFLSYLIIILAFMGLYLLNSYFSTPHLSWDEALVLSMSSFHGRGFFPSNISLGDTYARLSVVEAFLGLFVEVTLIATFTQRFFSK